MVSGKAICGIYTYFHLRCVILLHKPAATIKNLLINQYWQNPLYHHNDLNSFDTHLTVY